MRFSARAMAGWAVGTCMVSWALSACLSPTLPLPPPGAPDIAELSADRQSVRLVGSHAIPGADVTVRNESLANAPGLVVYADANGQYTFERLPVDLSTSTTNLVTVWQAYGSDRSDVVRVRVPYGVAFGAAPVDDAGATSEAGPSNADAGAE